MLRVQQFTVGGFDKNMSYVVFDVESREALIIDPTGDMSAAHAFIADTNLQVAGCVLTHTHADHVEQLRACIEKYTVPVFVHENGLYVTKDFSSTTLTDLDCIELNTLPIGVLYTPGHNLDSVCLYIAPQFSATGNPLLITGDTVFVDGCGKTNEEMVRQLYDSLERIKALPPQTVLYPGHDYGKTPTATIAEQLLSNQYFLAADFTSFKQLRLR